MYWAVTCGFGKTALLFAMTHIHPGRLLKAFIEAIWNFPETIVFAHMVYF